jgi:hypothetical protein
MWFITRMGRYNRELDVIAELAAEPWIENVKWRLDGGLFVDADLMVGAVRRSVTLAYPAIFPFAPPSVRPREGGERWSIHQYGTGGELCLEHRADNWQEHVTGADVLRSAHRLLTTEAGETGDPEASRVVPSAHRASLGQRLRSEPMRLVETEALAAAVAAASEPRAMTARMLVTGRNYVLFVVKIAEPGGAEWRDPTLPEPIGRYEFESGFALALPAGDARLRQVDAAAASGARALRSLLLGAELAFDSSETLLLSLPSGLRAFHVDPKNGAAIEYAIVPPNPGQRAAPGRDSFGDKLVGLLGAGSMGSKVAASLARAGVGKFLLIDDDVLGTENIARHELDWLEVGAHKVDGLAERLKLLRPGTTVDTRRISLGGQESSGSLHGALSALAKCDLIVEASGSDVGFNYAAGVAAESGRPMVWGRVFGGGYGGMIARSRPGLDPTPLDARAAIHAWCANPDFPKPPKATVDYGAEGADGEPMIADDADVGQIAASLARLAINTLLAAPESSFEHSAYMIGLSKEWIFTAAFDVWPVDLGAPAPRQAQPPSEKEVARAVEALTALFQKEAA